MELRGYQRAAVDAVWTHIRERDGNPLVVLPTGAGKSLVIARLVRDVVDWGGRVVCLSHVRELIRQVADHIVRVDPSLPVGVYSAGLGSRDTGYAVTVAGIQSVYQRAMEFGKVDICLVDEAHRVPADGEGMYRTFLEALRGVNPAVRLVGLTATPFRLSTGLLATPEGLFNQVVHETRIRELIRDGFLSPLTSKAGREKADLNGVGIQAGEFVQKDLEGVMGEDRLVALTALEIVERTQNRKSVLVFACGVAHGGKMAAALRDAGGIVGEVYGDTPTGDRDRIVKAFTAGGCKYVVNVDVLGTGFDAPGVDCVVMLRPTMSPGLMMQQCGRGFRIAPGKQNCLVLDFAGNLLRHGPVDMVIPPDGRKDDGKEGEAPAKECPDCAEIVPAGMAMCPACGHEFPRREARHSAKPGGQAMSDEPYVVMDVDYQVHTKKGAPPGAPVTLRVDYDVGMMWPVREFVCFDHHGFARQKAVQWWLKHGGSAPAPASVAEAMGRTAELLRPVLAWLEADGKYMRISRVELGERVEA